MGALAPKVGQLWLLNSKCYSEVAVPWEVGNLLGERFQDSQAARGSRHSREWKREKGAGAVGGLWAQEDWE